MILAEPRVWPVGVALAALAAGVLGFSREECLLVSQMLFSTLLQQLSEP